MARDYLRCGDMAVTSPFWLSCRLCGAEREPGSPDYCCSLCGGELVVQYAEFGPVTDEAGMWRYRARLPVRPTEVPISLGEGDTPLVPLGRRAHELAGKRSIAMKCEHLGPTGSFKDRIASVAVTIAVARNNVGLVGTSSGNGGAAAAAYCQRAGLPLWLFALSSIPDDKLLQLTAFGARVHIVDGVGFAAAATEATATAVARHASGAGVFPFLTGARFSPEAMEGAKTITYEVLEQQPEVEVIYAPVGGGGLVSALGRGLAELRKRGESVPRLVAVQPEGCATLRLALRGIRSGLDRPCTTTVSGLQMPVLFDPYGATDAVRESGGHVVEVSDEEIATAQSLLAADSGLLVEPAGAAAFAGALADARENRFSSDDTVVVIGTGAGYKDGTALRRIAGEQNVPVIGIDQLYGVLRDQH